ncbi:GGDEF domain-containing protein [Acidaminobacter sp. JC074]|uniref:bifunctional diguanylate cyclase/phosphodiesterase n=1 Tax=Acidaminobacter sp. JC074 TaxID=2530199 RepID=UPI001F1159F0|nr:bifunctional diguanylate cyclase/phosphodiesterase [Acidaminobacter sp. JC074]MCH4888812.1 GGDEF domain-containing protein [Acidaminobacter sp. JC074]
MFDNNSLYEKMIDSLEGSVHTVYTLGMVIMILAAVCRQIFVPKDPFLYLDILAALVLLLSNIFSARWSIVFRVRLAGGLFLVMSLLSLYLYGLEGGGLLLLIIPNAVAAFFEKKKSFLFCMIVSIIGMVVSYDPTNSFSYIISCIIFVSSALGIRVMIGGLRSAYVDNMRELNYNIQENDMIYAELLEQHEEVKKSKLEIYELAYYDKLTGLPNKVNFKETVSSRIASGNYGTMMLLDIKDFKILNSVHGMEMGDRLLKLVGEVVRDLNDPYLYACRISGNEFLFWYESLDSLHMRDLLNRMILEYNVRARKFFTYSKVHFRMAFVRAYEDGNDYLTLVDKLNAAIKYSKYADIDEPVRFKESMYVDLQTETQLKELIEDAIEKRAFNVYYQEKFDLKSNKVTGLEALARWQSDILGEVSPMIFIPIVQKYQMTPSFERLIIGKVLSDYPKLIEKYGPIKIGINISSEHISAKGFIKYFSDALMLYKVNPEHISLEITENILDFGQEKVLRVIKNLKELGVKIALDNIGQGYSFLDHVLHLPLDEIKLDRRFVLNIENKKVQKLLRAITSLKDDFEVSVVAEGVENESQLKIIREMGCTEVQGFLYQRPEPLSKLNKKQNNHIS